jgi:hypothetical protein
MEACTSTSSVILPLRAAPPRSAAAGAVACYRSRAGTRRRVRLVTARASLDRAAVLLDAAVGTGYSQASYYTSLGLFVLSVPGLWSLIKRSVKSKVSSPYSSRTCFLGFLHLVLFLINNHKLIATGKRLK